MILLLSDRNTTLFKDLESDPATGVFLILSGVVGMLLLSLSILSFAACRDRTWTKTPLINVSINLWLIDLLYMVYNVLEERINSDKDLRVILAIMEYFLILTVLMWTFLHAVVLYFFVKNLLKSGSDGTTQAPDWRWLLFYGYSIPFALSISELWMASVDYMYWLFSSRIMLITYISPNIILIVMSLVLFARIIVHLVIALRPQKENLQANKKLVMGVVLKGLVQFVFTTCPTMATFFPDRNDLGAWRTGIQFFVFQQGTFIFLVYCVLDPKVREKYRSFLGAWCRPKSPNISPDVQDAQQTA